MAKSQSRRVLIMSPTFINVGGVETATRNMIEAIDAECEITLLTMRDPPRIDSKYQSIIIASGNRFSSAFLAVAAIVKYAKRGKFTLVSLWPPANIFNCLVKVLLRIFLIRNTIHIACEHSDVSMVSFGTRIMRRILYRFLDRVIVLDRLTQIYMRSVSSHISVIPNSVDTTLFSPKEKRNVIISAGHLNTNKNTSVLVDACILLRDVLRQRGWTCDIFGDGPERARLAETIRQAGISDVVRLKGGKRGLQEEFATSRVFVLPSYSEGQPLSVLEAMASECVVIFSSTLAGVIEMTRCIPHYTFDPDSSKDLAAVLLQAIGTDDGTTIAESRLVVLSKYSREAVAKDWRGVFHGS